MRIGYCVNMLSLSESDGSGREFIPMVRELGFDYVELPLAQMMVYDDDAFTERFLKPLRQAGIECRCCNNFFPADLRLTGPNADMDAALRYAEAAMRRAKLLGARKIVFGSAGARNAPAGFSREKAVEQLAAFLKRLAPIAEGYGITLVIEHLNRLESNLINSLGEGIALAERVDHPNVRVLLDSYHMTISGGDKGEIAQTGSLLQHVHLARTLGRSLPCPGDEEDWPALAETMHAIGYDGDCSIEAYAPVEKRKAAIASSLAYLRGIL